MLNYRKLIENQLAVEKDWEALHVKMFVVIVIYATISDEQNNCEVSLWSQITFRLTLYWKFILFFRLVKNYLGQIVSKIQAKSTTEGLKC